MKNVIFYSLLLICVISVKAQEVTQLEATTVTFITDGISHMDNDAFIVRENYAGEFSENPVKFMNQNFDIKSYISYLELKRSMDPKKSHNESYEVTFSTSKGDLVAKFSKDGELVETSQNFKNIVIPSNIREELYASYKGWSMVKNTYTASGKSDQIDKEQYRIKLKNGNRSQIVKIVPNRAGSDVVARD
ncbi:MAG: hypothetical protein MUP24_02680 [Gillisia sp.]|nr:hypothetical protein [Gillisia sp.]